MIKNIALFLLMPLTAVSIFAGTVNVTWNASLDPTVNRYKVYAAPGTNTMFADRNTNATVVLTVTNGVVGSVSNLYSGAWTFTSRAVATNGLESENSTSIWTNVLPPTIMNFRFLNVQP